MDVAFAILIVLLGSNSFATREAAHAVLSKNADAAIVHLLAGEQSQDAEVAGRCRLIVNDWYRRHAPSLVDSHMPKGWKRWPFIFWGAGRERCGNYLDQAHAAGVTHKGKWEDYSEATRLWAIDKIAARVDFSRELAELCDADEAWCRQNSPELLPEKRP